MGRLGYDISAPAVQSRRSPQEKQPWKDLAGIENQVEAAFLRPILLGESILPFRIFHPFEGIIPVTQSGEVLNAKGALERGFDHLAGWMRKAEKVWNDNSESGDMKLVERWNYHNELGSQFPPSSLRVVYAASGTNPAACVLREPFVIEHKLYWSAPDTVGESRYLMAILNSETIRKRSESKQSRGQWGARDFDKVAFNLPIPRFNSKIDLHSEIAGAAAKAEKIAAEVELPANAKFQRARGFVRNALAEDGIAATIDDLVALLLDGET